ncbi:glutamate--cysteine ligase [Auritidibacter sp. NML120636]|uniref:glutamate--cysteine ligase n=1 Tax=Auritidibacter sp. NML120636 TaxID=2170743 RepID=UPI000D72C391|nr:glutamate--cysteine ligase [Auritidibacter sp. NML120636]PXA79563.1 glutamate--cysteine ligase [Auritidibacter sp. NML120636]
MGTEIDSDEFTYSQRSRYRELLESSLTALREYLAEHCFEDQNQVGLELELNLIDQQGLPAFVNEAVLADLDTIDTGDADFAPELGRFTIELNHPVLEIAGTGLQQLEESLRTHLRMADRIAENYDARVVPVGILPSLRGEDMIGEDWLSAGTRFKALNRAVMSARGEELLVDIHGEDHLQFYAQNIAIEAACTSMQLHIEVTADLFSAVWNAAQAIAGPQIALAANSPLFIGTQLWHETRIPVFQQAVDDRAPEYARQGVRPRVWFGDAWVDTIDELYAENLAFFPSLLPEQWDSADSHTALGAPKLHELNLHNGTVYRWNRPIYDPGSDTRPAHLRVENRLLPAGPTATDMVANTAFFFGVVRSLVDSENNPWERMSFAAARSNFYACAKHGLAAWVYWPGYGELPVTELLDRYLIPLATEGLQLLNVESGVADRLFKVLTGRIRSGQTGAVWQLNALKALEQRTRSRPEALAELTRIYADHVAGSQPVHTWDPA